MSSFNLNRLKLYTTLAIMVIGAILFLGFFGKDHFQQAALPEDDRPLVRTMVLKRTADRQNYSYPGEVRGRRESPLAFQVGGKITQRLVELGDVVTRGQLLMQIDPQDIREVVNSQLAQVAAAQSQLQLAESNLKRYRQLYEQEVISRAQLERHQNAYEVAQAALQQVKAQYDRGLNQLGYCSLHSDRAGVVSGVTAEVGQVVGPGQIVLTLVSEGDREIEINVPENRLPDLRKSSDIKITFWALPDLAVGGKIREIAPMADAVARTYKVRITLLQPPAAIKLGMTATANIGVMNNQAMTIPIPLSALYQTKETPSVWIVREGKVQLRPIKIGRFGNDGVQVVDELTPGETIVTAGVHKLRAGQRVNILDGGKP